MSGCLDDIAQCAAARLFIHFHARPTVTHNTMFSHTWNDMRNNKKQNMSHSGEVVNQKTGKLSVTQHHCSPGYGYSDSQIFGLFACFNADKYLRRKSTCKKRDAVQIQKWQTDHE